MKDQQRMIDHQEMITMVVQGMRNEGSSDQQIIDWLILRYAGAMDSLRSMAEINELFKKPDRGSD